MNSTPLSSPTKMNNHSSIDDSPKDDEHDWDSYLIETNSEAAPASNFRQALIPPVNEFNINDKLECIDPRNQDSWCIGTIIDKDGPRIRIRLDGTDNRNDFWRLVDSGDIRVYGSTEKFGGQIVPPLGFQQTSSRWKSYFDRKIKSGPFASESCFKSQPPKPEKNFFKKGQKLEAVDPKHPNMICPATVSNVIPGNYQITISLDGWSSSNDFKINYLSRDIFPVGWCKSAGIQIVNIGGNLLSRSSNKILPSTPNKSNGTNRQLSSSKTKKSTPSSSSNTSSYSPTTMDEKNNNLTSVKRRPPIVTVYLNYLGDNSGMFLNPQKFHSSMSSKFGPDECDLVLSSIFNSSIKCAFKPTTFIQTIQNTFSKSKDEKNHFYTQIKLENGSMIYVNQLENPDDFWNVIRTFENDVLSSNDLFSSTPPISTNNQSNGSFSSFLDSSTSPDKKDNSPSNRLENNNNNNIKRKSTEFSSYPEEKTFLSNGKTPRMSTNEKSVYDTKTSLSITKPVANGTTSRRPEKYSPMEVAEFIRNIDTSFDSLAVRFLQEEIDGKALLLLTTDTLMRHMGLKLGPSLKIVHHIEQLKKSS